MLKFTYRDLQKCAEREVALRQRVCAKHGKDTPQDIAEVEMMEAIAEHFKELAEPSLKIVFEDMSGERRISSR